MVIYVPNESGQIEVPLTRVRALAMCPDEGTTGTSGHLRKQQVPRANPLIYRRYYLIRALRALIYRDYKTSVNTVNIIGTSERRG